MKYYDIRDDLNRYPNAWCYLIWSKRGPGKTYSTLRYMIEEKKKFVFLKRTKDDVKLLCAGGKQGVNFDMSPFVPLNRDFGWDIKPMKIEKGIAGFYHSIEGKPAGDPVGYCVALSAATDIKGFDLSEADFLIFDEFIPKSYEIVKRNEGDALLDIYMTVSRDRIKRGRGELKLICLANATSINNPTFNILDVTDTAAEMDIYEHEFLYQEERKILMHKIMNIDPDAEEKSGIEIAMSGTAWHDMSFSGSFAYDDFSAVKHQRMKGYAPFVSYIYKKKQVFIYQKDGYYYANTSRNNKCPVFNLSRENEQKRFYLEYVIDLRNACIEDKMQFTSYSMYDLIVNYRKIFKI
ncbi:MAG: phage DNA encapsidation protein [Methanobrevibacter sp.]|nr:phage DNA encapsidation protein [Methanobrevibacter sp.]